jgi:D-glycero-D-manno-heptose 1,7-bisphosphate phosphatase
VANIFSYVVLMIGEKKKQKVVFLDRDGVINRDSPDYIKSWSEFEFLPGSLEALKKLTMNGFVVMVITNQSVIHRKMISLTALEHIHDMMKKTVLSSGGDIKDIFFCPHIPEDQCDCRKPNTGLILKAEKKHRIDLKASIMVGDSAKDIECARNAGCGTVILVKTGNGALAEKQLKEKMIRPDVIVQDLLEAAHWIISRNPPAPSPGPSQSHE